MDFTAMKAENSIHEIHELKCTRNKGLIQKVSIIKQYKESVSIA